MEAGYEIFDHTADAGLIVRAATMPDLIAPAGAGLYALIGELVPAAGEGRVEAYAESGEEAALLLRDYMAHLLVAFEHGNLMVVKAGDVLFDEQTLRVAVRFRPVDMERSVFHREVKAVTYHDLRIDEIECGWQATIIVDI